MRGEVGMRGTMVTKLTGKATFSSTTAPLPMFNVVLSIPDIFDPCAWASDLTWLSVSGTYE
jgi:hypothetical protein